MTASPDPVVPWNGRLSGEPSPLTVEHMGLEYTGELVGLGRWEARWGRPLESDAYFRIVLLEERGEVEPEEVQDSRIAVCIPSRNPSRRRADVTSERSAIRETQALYLTGRSGRGDVIRGYLAGQLEDLEQKVISEEAARYAAGRIVSPTIFSDDIDWIFAGGAPAEWHRRLARTLLSWAYPSLPIDSIAMPAPLGPSDVPAILRDVLAEVPEEGSSLERFGPALGLSEATQPSSFDPRGCRVFQEISAVLEEHNGHVAWEEVRLRLSHGLGLPQPLAALYLLTFFWHGRPDTELVLLPGQGICIWDGSPLRGDTLTREFLPLLLRPEDLLVGEVSALRLSSAQATWNGALAYTAILSQRFEEAEEGSPEAASQEEELLELLKKLAEELDGAQDVLNRLSDLLLGNRVAEAGSSLGRLGRLAKARDFGSFYREARASFDGPRQLMADLEVRGRLLSLGESLEEISAARTYLAAIDISDGKSPLSFDRATLLAEMSPSVLLESPDRWQAIGARFREYRSRYRRDYIDHHGRYQVQAPTVIALLDGCRQKLHALSLLNSIAELGDPVGEELGQRYIDLELMVKRCQLDLEGLDLDSIPVCDSCRLTIGEMPPGRQVRAFATDLERALEEHNRRLSAVLVQRILHDRVDQPLENLLKIVQASDLTGLSDVLDYELAVFIQELLRAP